MLPDCEHCCLLPTRSNLGRKSVNKVKAATLLKSRHCRLALAGCRQFTLLIAAVASYYQHHNQGNSAVNMQEIQNVQGHRAWNLGLEAKLQPTE